MIEQRCHQTWPDLNSIRTHVCCRGGRHLIHVCGACGARLNRTALATSAAPEPVTPETDEREG